MLKAQSESENAVGRKKLEIIWIICKKYKKWPKPGFGVVLNRIPDFDLRKWRISPFSILKIRMPAQNDPESGFWPFFNFFADHSDNFQFFATHGIFWLLLSFEHYAVKNG